jgi:hypothetical protein
VIQVKYQELDQGCLSSDPLKTAIDLLELTIRGSPLWMPTFCLCVCLSVSKLLLDEWTDQADIVRA